MDDENRNRNYWGEREEKLMTILAEAFENNDKPTQVRIFNRIRNKLRILIENIMVRYYLGNYNFHETELIVNDVMTHILTSLDKFDYNRNTKWFSYLGTLAKHQLYSMLVQKLDAGFKDSRRNHNKLDLVNYDEFETPIDSTYFPNLCEKIDDETDTIEKKELLHKIIEEKIVYHQKELEIGEKKKLKGKIKTHTKCIEAAESLKQTLKNFSETNMNGATIGDIVVYISENFGVTSYYLNKCFDTTVFVAKPVNYVSKKKAKRYPNDMIDLDYTPDVMERSTTFKYTKMMKMYEEFPHLQYRKDQYLKQENDD